MSRSAEEPKLDGAIEAAVMIVNAPPTDRELLGEHFVALDRWRSELPAVAQVVRPPRDC